jgi:hypothetical protein
VGVHSLTLSCTPENMKCDFQASLLACTFASPCLGREPKTRVTTHKIHHGLDLGEATTFPFIIFYMSGHEGYTQMSFFPRTPTTLEAQNFLCRPSIEMRSKQTYISCQDLSNDMWHITCTKVNQGYSWLLVVGNQIGTLTPDPSFSHNLHFKYSNGTCEPIINI